MGVMGAIAPWPKKVVGAMPPSRTTGMSLFFETVKCAVKLRICHYASDKNHADFCLKMHQKRLAAGLCRDPLGELAYCAPRHQLDLRGGAGTREGERGKDRRETE